MKYSAMSPEECIDKLEQLVFDENELVTYKLLSKELQIHVNEAKKYLYDFLIVQMSKEDVKLYAYYFLSGVIAKDGVQSKKVVIVSEDNLDRIKKEFKEVTGCHIYSINKGGCRDESVLYNSQSWSKKWAEEHREYSSIKHPNVVIQAPSIKKADVKKSDIKIVSKAPIVKLEKKESKPTLFQKAVKRENENGNTLSKEKSTNNIVETSKTPISKNEQAVTPNTTKPNSETEDPKKSTLSSLWQKLEDKSKTSKAESSKPQTKGKNKSQGPAKNNIMSMFSKQAEKNAANPIKKTTSNSVSPVKQTSPSKENLNNNSISPKVEKQSPVKKAVKVTTKRKPSQRKTKRSTKPASEDESDEEIKPKKKKHRRICTMDDSDSESESEEAKDRAQRSLLSSEEPIQTPMVVSDDNEEPIPPTPPVLNDIKKKKVWKTVQKTFEDEDGFLVAKQEKVFVSASDSDEEPLPSKSTASKSEAKQNTFLYRKQASLTSFFKQQ